jgi:hypothetical protein
MNKLLLLCLSVLLTGCATTVPVAVKFPEAPEVLLKPCDPLDTIGKDQILFSEFLKTVVSNYTKRHQCAAQVEAWIEWYKKQEEIVNNVSK